MQADTISLGERILVAISPAVAALLGVALTMWNGRKERRADRADAALASKQAHERQVATSRQDAQLEAYAAYLAEADLISLMYVRGTPPPDDLSKLMDLFLPLLQAAQRARMLAPQLIVRKIDEFTTAVVTGAGDVASPVLIANMTNARGNLTDAIRAEIGVEPMLKVQPAAHGERAPARSE